MKAILHSLHADAMNFAMLAQGGGGEAGVTVPDPERKAPPKLANAVDTVLGIVGWAGTAAGVAGVLITGTMMAVSMKRGEGSEHMSRLGMVLGGCVLVATAGPIITFVFQPAGEE